MEKTDEGLKALLDSGKEKGYLTFSQVNDYLPDDAVNPEKLDQLLLVLEEQGIELIDESEAEEREAGPSGAAEDDARGDRGGRQRDGAHPQFGDLELFGESLPGRRARQSILDADEQTAERPTVQR